MSTTVDASILRNAAVWMARLWSDTATDMDHRACAQWRGAHPDHERAWQQLQCVDARLDSLPRPVARKALLDAPVVADVTRRRATQLLGLGITGAASFSMLRGTSAWQGVFADYATAVGEIRRVDLPDGSRVVLNTDSAIDVRFDANVRMLTLRRGEIQVSTAIDAARRAFRVETGFGDVTPIGTVFTVRREADAAAVAVYEGAVQMLPAYASMTTRLNAGLCTRFDAEHVAAATATEHGARGWTRGVLVAERMRVADFAAQLGRYRRGFVRCDPALADLRVTGVFPLTDTDRALTNLALVLPVDIVYHSRWWVTLQSRAV